MKILTFSTLYPNAESPGHGIFVETRLRHLLADFDSVSAKVVAPVPWFPFKSQRFGTYGKFAQVPQAEHRNGIAVAHPRYLRLPKIGMTSTPYLLAKASLPILQNVICNGFDFDIIDAHYFFPDGVAAAMLGKKLNKPVVVTARGSDINLISTFPVPRKMILHATRDIAASITVSEGLKSRMIELGAEPGKIHVLRNGVDLTLFRPVDRDIERRRLGWRTKILLSVGNLLELKGHHLVIEALKSLPDYRLVIVGSGTEAQSLCDCAQTHAVADRVDFVSSIPQDQLRNYYGAADALILASSREGWANVLLESVACGTPVIATKVGGNPEVISTTDAGILLSERSPMAIQTGVETLFRQYPDHAATRRYAEKFDWHAVSQGQMDLFHAVIDQAKSNRTRQSVG